MERHAGKRVAKSFGFKFGGLNRPSIVGDEPKVGFDAVVYFFKASRIKGPLSTGCSRTAGATRTFSTSSSPTRGAVCPSAATRIAMAARAGPATQCE